MKKVLVINNEVLNAIREKFDLSEVDEVFNRVIYTSPNGFINRSISLVELEEYNIPSSFSFPTFDLSAYEKIAEDILDYKKFMDSFELEDFDIAVERVLNNLE